MKYIMSSFPRGPVSGNSMCIAHKTVVHGSPNWTMGIRPTVNPRGSGGGGGGGGDGVARLQCRGRDSSSYRRACSGSTEGLISTVDDDLSIYMYVNTNYMRESLGYII